MLSRLWYTWMKLMSVCLGWQHDSKRGKIQWQIKTQRSQCESPIETRLYNALVKNGLQPRTQYRVGPYRIDIAVLANGQKIAVECDGKAYHSSPAQKAHDRKKDRYLRKHGWTVLRFTGSQINRNAYTCAHKIKTRIRAV